MTRRRLDVAWFATRARANCATHEGPTVQKLTKLTKLTSALKIASGIRRPRLVRNRPAGLRN